MDVDENASEKLRWLRVSWKCGRFAFNLRFNPVVTFLSAAIIWFFVIWCSVQTDVASDEMKKWMKWITHTCTWMYIGTQDAWALFIIVLYFSKYGNMKLGKPDDKPDFSDATYFTMLFAAGIGVGLFYFGVGMYLFLTVLGSIEALPPKDAASSCEQSFLATFSLCVHSFPYGNMLFTTYISNQNCCPAHTKYYSGL